MVIGLANVTEAQVKHQYREKGGKRANCNLAPTWGMDFLDPREEISLVVEFGLRGGGRFVFLKESWIVGFYQNGNFPTLEGFVPLVQLCFVA